ncbi:uncharacterized protein LOC135265469 [Tribolium castaneum]|uniref:uncharacterized protein LOC135265448 n=1 Tax=Tribolium castaneum TaxID=7070 RepID=UPI00046C346D|nr:PREDICTED: uncharacterized protein LOC103314662 isoform X2 [Tribolium castaneum]|eukprot:XP_008199439.1 PREDICTED: uncharacterized protein LOC103314662 isoform X2 [Tribolium castaneum]
MWVFVLVFAVFKELGIQAMSFNPAKMDDRKGLTFPDSSEIGGDFLYETVVPNCQNHTYCEHLDRYPNELFSKILKSREKEFSRYFQSMAVIEPIMSRNQDTSCICASRKSIIYPKAAYNIKNNLKFIYNFDGYKQGVSVEVCVIKNQMCKFYEKVRKLKTRCRQKFVEKLLLTADENGRPYADRYRFPSACVCSYKIISSNVFFT